MEREDSLLAVLLDDVAQRFAVPAQAICSALRKAELVVARQAVWLVLSRLDWPVAQIARATGVDWATVNTGLKRCATADDWFFGQVSDLIETYAALRAHAKHPQTPEERKAKRAAANRVRYATDPAFRARQLARNRAYRPIVRARHKTDPAYAARRQQQWRESWQRRHPTRPKTHPTRQEQPNMARPRPRPYNNVGAAVAVAKRQQPEARQALTVPAQPAQSSARCFADLSPLEQAEVGELFARLQETIAHPDERLAEAGRRVLGIAVVWE